MSAVKRTKKKISTMKKILPIVSRPVNRFGVFAITTARDPVDIVTANHGLVMYAMLAVAEDSLYLEAGTYHVKCAIRSFTVACWGGV